MRGSDIEIRASEGAAFGCYLAVPPQTSQVPAIVLASTIRGVDTDMRAIADEFAAHGFIAAAPDLFWRPGGQRSRLEQIKSGESDMADALASLRTLCSFNGRAAAMGFCYGGPYAILGPKRLGYAAGISCHGTQMLDYVNELEGVRQPICLLWGDDDDRAPAEVLDAYRGVPPRMKNVEVHIFPRVRHGFMIRGNAKGFDSAARNFSMGCALAMLEAL